MVYADFAAVTDGFILWWWHIVHKWVDLCHCSSTLMRRLYSSVLFCSPSAKDPIVLNFYVHLLLLYEFFPTHLHMHCQARQGYARTHTHTHNKTALSSSKKSIALHSCWWMGVKNRREINWIIKNMQMNSFQFKCRFWIFFCSREREGGGGGGHRKWRGGRQKQAKAPVTNVQSAAILSICMFE